ncbi:MAG: DUF1311 domain-containing protein [Lachnospiraceae bacterium]|nr:DUF1311 domain-containing protein [Lachnospiraceae bacterium]
MEQLMKMKGIWIAIILILGVGILTTSYTKEYISVPVETRKPDMVNAPQVEAAGGMQAEAAKLPEAPQSEEAAAGTAGVLGAAKARAMPEAAAAAETEAQTIATGTRLRLQELDDQIARNHASEQDTTTNSMKATAQSERKLWESEVERILKLLSEQLGAEERDSLFQQQKEWIRERESIAVTASQKQSGSALEELEYNLSLKDMTRERAYELETQYHDILMEAE